MTRSVLLGIAFAGLTVASCKKSDPEEVDHTPEEPKQSGEQTAEQVPAKTPEQAAEVNMAREAVVPLALDVGRSKHHLTAGILVRPDHPGAGGNTFVAYLAPPGKKVRRAIAWLEAEQKWVRLNSPTAKVADLAVAQLSKQTAQPVFDLSRARKIPQTLTSLLVPEWDEALDDQPPAKSEPDADAEAKRIKTEEFQEAYNAMQDEMNELQRPLPSNERPRDRRAAMELENERRKRSVELSREMSKLRSEASREGIRLSSRGGSSSSSRSTLPYPTRRARMVSVSLQATLDPAGEEDENPSSSMKGENLPEMGILPGALLAQQGEGGLQVFGLEKLAELFRPEISMLSAYFVIGNGSQVELNLSASLAPTALKYSRLRVGIAPKGEVPGNLEDAPIRDAEAASSSASSIDARLTIPGKADLNLDPAQPPVPMEAVVEVKTSLSEEWMRLEPFYFTIKLQEDGSLVPKLEESESIVWKGPKPSSRSSTPSVPEAILSSTLEARDAVRSFQAGGGHTLAVRFTKPDRVKFLDLRTEKWRAELALPAGSERSYCTADAERLFVLNPSNRTLASYSLADLKPLKTVTLPGGALQVLIAAGYNAKIQPVAVLSDEKMELRDPATLQLYDTAIRSSSAADISVSEWAAFPLLLPAPGTNHQLLASSRGDHFACQVSFKRSERNPEVKYFAVRNHRTIWTYRTARGIPSNNGTLYNGTVAEIERDSNGGYSSRRSSLQRSLTYLLPASGPGDVGVSITNSSRTMPAAPLRLYYMADVDAKEPALESQGGVAASEWLTSSRVDSSVLAGRLMVLPDLGKIVSLAADRITIEKFTMPENAPLPALAGPVPAAYRGKIWSYRSLDADGKPRALVLSKGPAGAAVNSEGALTWEVPANFPTDSAIFEVDLGTPGHSQTLVTSVYGLPAANLRKPGGQDAAVIPTKSIIPFAEKVDKILPSHSGQIVAVISGGFRHVTIVDLEKLEVVASHACTSGPAAFGLAHRSLYIWHLDGNLLETRNLPDLAPGTIQPLDTSEPLFAFIVGSAPNSLPPLALFANETRRHFARTVDPESSRLGPPILLPQTFGYISTSYSQNKPPVEMPPASGTGSNFYLNGNIATRHPNGEISAVRSSNSSSRGPVQFTMDGSLLITSHTATNIATGRSWTVNLGKLSLGTGANNILWPDLSLRHVLALTQYENQNRTKHARIHILDAQTQEVLHEIDQLFEWDGGSSALFTSNLSHSRLVYSSQHGTLLTLSADGRRLVARKLPPEANK